MALRAVIDEAGFERGLDARDPSFVDVGFFLFFGRDLDGKVVQFLTINQRDAQLLLLSCIDEHSLHLNWTLVICRANPITNGGYPHGRQCEQPRDAEVHAVRPKMSWGA